MLCKSSLILLCVFPVILGPSISNESSTNLLTKLVGSFRGPNGINISQFLSTFRMPSCMKQCLPELDGLLMAMSKSNDTKDLATICSEIQSSTHCASNAGCSKVFVEAAASAFQFICLDNIHSLSESVACVKDTALDIQPECEAHCSVQSRIVEDASNNKIEAVFQVPRLCNSTRCLLTCFKNKIDTKCRIGEKNLLDSLLSAVVRGGDHGFDSALDWIMPDSCRLKGSKFSNDSSSFSSPIAVGQVPRGPSMKNRITLTKNANSALDSILSPTMTNRIPSKNGVEKAKIAVGVGSGKPGPLMVRLPPATKTSENATQPVEAALIIDGEIRTLRYQLFDWQGNPVPSPDFETLAKIMTLQLLPFKFPPQRPGETVILPTEEDEKAAEKRLEEKIAKDEKDSKAGDDWRSEQGPKVERAHPEDATNEGIGVAIGLIVFAATIFYWAWEVSRDLE